MADAGVASRLTPMLASCSWRPQLLASMSGATDLPQTNAFDTLGSDAEVEAALSDERACRSDRPCRRRPQMSDSISGAEDTLPLARSISSAGATRARLPVRHKPAISLGASSLRAADGAARASARADGPPRGTPSVPARSPSLSKRALSSSSSRSLVCTASIATQPSCDHKPSCGEKAAPGEAVAAPASMAPTPRLSMARTPRKGALHSRAKASASSRASSAFVSSCEDGPPSSWSPPS
mmetsp:Transcript_27386/g.83269  ORF Transcript_27386/g.83269 Transcript_27386/m.83269 type:complete len:239 (+) Transcript_27386:2877-3593(+)